MSERCDQSGPCVTGNTKLLSGGGGASVAGRRGARRLALAAVLALATLAPRAAEAAAPFANNINPPPIPEDTLEFVTLSYSDADGDLGPDSKYYSVVKRPN